MKPLKYKNINLAFLARIKYRTDYLLGVLVVLLAPLSTLDKPTGSENCPVKLIPQTDLSQAMGGRQIGKFLKEKSSQKCLENCLFHG